MMTISKPSSAGQARRCHAEEFQNARENYDAEGERISGRWHGQLATKRGLSGDVGEEDFNDWRRLPSRGARAATSRLTIS